jgi:protoporphyrinogen IX oxidase
MSPGFLGEAYPWVKALHVILVIFWIAGLLMLPRFFAYHVEDMAADKNMDMIWQQREARLLRIIMNPAMILAWILGILLVLHGGYWTQLWFVAKFLLVVGLSGFHGFLAGVRKKFVRSENQRSSKFYRAMNEVPSLGTIVIVLLVILQPWG